MIELGSGLRRVALVAFVAAAGCQFGPGERRDPNLEGLAVTDLQPRVALPGTTFVVSGRSFAGAPWGAPHLQLSGSFDDGSGPRPVELTVPARFVDFDRLEVAVDDAFIAALGGDTGTFEGTAAVLIDSNVDGERHGSPGLGISLRFAAELSPELGTLRDDGLLFVNDWIEIEGGGLLLGGDEGQTVAVVSGCFQPAGGAECAPVEPVEVPVEPASAFDRTSGRFAFSPAIAGIGEGRFSGEVLLRNRHALGGARDSAAAAVAYELTGPAVLAVSPASASIGQYVRVLGGGFLGDDAGSTVLQLVGEYTPEGSTEAVPIDVVLVPEFVEGREVRYLVNEDDALGQLFDVRYASGTFTGEVRPEVSYGAQTVTGDSVPMVIRLAPVKQVVHLRFTSQYVGALQHFGLRAMDAEIRRRVVEVVERDFAGVNLEVRTETPDDFALYSEVEIGGPDPNGLGLLGYDNTPGKDVGNERLHDRIGGVNATTQKDGYPGFGGVFIESMFVFSEHPADFAPAAPTAADPLFDDVFDPFRPDRGGEPVRAADLEGGVPALSDPSACPAADRPTQIACAAYALANLIGTTISHELGHSLGLANPDGGTIHYLSDAPNRIMDSGSNRPFAERAELGGQGPARFCDSAHAYLRLILPTDEDDGGVARPTCL